MNVEDNMDDIENENVNEISVYWIPKEIKLYDELMLQQIDNQKIDDEEQNIKDDMWQQSTHKYIFEEVEDTDEQTKIFSIFL